MIPAYTPIAHVRKQVKDLGNSIDNTREELKAQLEESHKASIANLQQLMKVLDECESEIRAVSERRK